jgi:hypothetical protein
MDDVPKHKPLATPSHYQPISDKTLESLNEVEHEKFDRDTLSTDSLDSLFSDVDAPNLVSDFYDRFFVSSEGLTWI